MHWKNKLQTALAVTAFTLLTLSATQTFGSDKHKKNKLAVDKVKDGLSIMVLGSGAPAAQPNGRASAGYMIFLDGKAKILMDAGGGVYQRIADSGLSLTDLEFVLFSHLHVDHVGDIDPVVKALFFHNRLAGFPRDPAMKLHMYGPDKAPDNAPPPALRYPTTTTFVDGHFDGTHGIEAYLNDFANVIGGIPLNYMVHDVPHNNALGVNTIYNNNGLVIKAIGVPHGPAPSLAFRIEYKGKSIAYSGDTTSTSAGGNMIAISDNADLLIYDTAILDGTGAPFINLHTTPTRMGEVARDANARKLVLSHLTPITEPNLDAVEASVKAAGYTGEITVAKDLKVFNLRHDDD
jgi:ribonuclease BN (tRNA processing enzyme)